jgi:hypothetical protein
MTFLLASSAYPAQVEWNGGAERDLVLGASQEKAREVFEFTNSGKDPISITAVRASCGCTVPEYSKNIVMPSSKGEITLEYHARPPGFGRTVSALVEFSDGTSSSLSWRIASANSTPAKQIPLVSWSAGDMSDKKITVEIPEGHSISGVVSPPEVTVEPGIPAAGKMEVKIIRKSPRPFWGAIMLNTVPPLDDGSARINVRAAP